MVKTDASSSNTEKVASFRSKILDEGIGDRVPIIDQNMKMEDVLDLTASMEAYLSLHRAEGLGLGILESMSLGVPVVATGYGGNMEFMRHDNSFIVPFEYRTWSSGSFFPKQMQN